MLVTKEQSESGYNKFGAMLNWDELNELIGQLLTYVDATYTDLEQRKAHKSIVKNLVRDWYYSCEKQLPVKMRFVEDTNHKVAVPEYHYWDTQNDGTKNPQ